MKGNLFCISCAALVILPVLSASGDAPVGLALKDDLIVPGYRVGPVHAECTREELGLIYGKRKLEDISIHVGEGIFMPGTIVKGGSDVEIQVIWLDEEMDMPAGIFAVGTALRTEDGIGIGTTLAELEEIIGPFGITGFGWDYAGTILLEGTTLSEYSGSLFIRLMPDPEVIASEAEAFESVQDDREYSSSDPSMRLLAPSVYELLLGF